MGEKTTIKFECPKCHQWHQDVIDSTLVTGSKIFPVRYPYVHDASLVILCYIDAHFTIRGFEQIVMGKSTVDTLVKKGKEQKEAATAAEWKNIF